MLITHLKKLFRLGKERATDLVFSRLTPNPSLPTHLARKRIIFIGASIGNAWRLSRVYPNIQTWTHYEFDKSPLVRKAIAEEPDAILIKECAAYFPQAAARRDLLEKWVRQIRAVPLRPILATVVPVTRAHAAANPGRAEAIWAFNDYLRELAKSHDVPLLDLEAALRSTDEDRHLADAYDGGDGLHLSANVYRDRLDGLIPPLLARTFEAT